MEPETLENIIAVAKIAGTAGLVTIGTGFFALGLRTAFMTEHERFAYQENKKRIDPKATWRDKLTGFGYRPLYEGDRRVTPVLMSKKNEDGTSTWVTKYTLTNTAIREVYGSRL